MVNVKFYARQTGLLIFGLVAFDLLAWVGTLFSGDSIDAERLDLLVVITVVRFML